MNKTQKKIIGWALISIGVVMVVGAVVNEWPVRWTQRDMEMYRKSGAIRIQQDFGVLFKGLLTSPFFYLGLLLGVGGVVVLRGDNKDKSIG